MRKVLFNIFLVIEAICNMKVLMVVYLITSVVAVLCAYDTASAEKLGSYLTSADSVLSAVVMWLIIVSLVATALKMLINQTGAGLGVGFLKAIVPFISGVILLVASGKVQAFLLTKFEVTGDYQELVFKHLIPFWVLLIIVIVKSVVNSNAGFAEVSQLTGSNEVALKYFDGILSDVDLDACDILALKYGGDE